MRLPSRWLIEYDRYKTEEFRNNSGIYQSLTDEQIEAVKRYFRWKTRMQFRRTLKGTKLERKPQKAEALLKIMGDADDWEYDGCVDTGYLGGGHCGLGHALRYEHYAVSPSTNREIIFGVNCASDFFGIDPKVLRKINTIQDETLDEIKKIVFIMNTGKHGEYQNTYYGDLLEVLNVLKGHIASTFGVEWDAHMDNFLRCGLPLTQSMVERFEWVKKKAYAERKKEIEEQEKALLAVGVQGDFSKSQFIKGVKKDSPAYVKAVLSYISYYSGDGKVPTDDKRRWGQALLDKAVVFDQAYAKIKEIGVKNMEEFSKSSRRVEVWMHAKNGDRIATKLEVETFSEKQFVKTEYPLGKEKDEWLQLLTWGVTGTNSYYKSSGCKNDESVIRKLEYSYKKMSGALDWVMSEGFEQDVRRLAVAYKNGVEYLDSAKDEEPGPLMFNTMVDVVIDGYGKIKQNSFQEMAIDIAHKFKRGIKLSDKQKNIIKSAYEDITKAKNPNKDTKSNEETDIIRKAKYVVDNAKTVKSVSIKKNIEFGYKVSKTVVQYGRVSDKQKKYIEEAYNELKKYNGENSEREQAKQIFIDDKQAKRSTAESFDFDKQDKDEEKEEEYSGYNPDVFDDSAWDPGNYDYDSSSEESVFEEDFDGYKYSKKYEPKETTACFISGVPSIVDISEALGKGVFLTEGDE